MFKKFESIMKKGKEIKYLQMKATPLINIKTSKLRDPKKLLNLCDNEWQANKNFNFYKKLLEDILSDNVPKMFDDNANREEEDENG